MARLIGAFVAYKLIKQLATPWIEWDAYKLGLIDDKGKTLRKAKTPEEKEVMDHSMRLVKNVKKLIELIPFGRSKIGTLAAAMWLLKEDQGVIDDKDFDAEIEKYINIPKNMVIEAEQDKFLPHGKYVHNDTNAMYHITENKEPDTNYLNVPLYRVRDLKTREYTIVSEDDIRRV